MARRSPARSSKLSAEERRLLKEQEELRRKEEQLQRKLRTLPVQFEARKNRERELAKLRAHMVSPAISLGGVRGSRSGKSSTKCRSLPARELQNARTRFFALCFIFAILLFWLWFKIPR